MGAFNTTLNGFAASLKKDIDKKLEAIQPPAPPAGDPPADPPIQESKTINELNLRIAQNEKTQKTLQEKVDAAEKATEAAKAQAMEEKRIAGFQSAIADIPFASPKARQQFTDAYIGKVKYADDGSLIVDTDTGPIGHAAFLQAEAENSPHFLAPQGQGGAGANAGKKGPQSKTPDIREMTTAQILKMTPEEQSQSFAENYKLAMTG